MLTIGTGYRSDYDKALLFKGGITHKKTILRLCGKCPVRGMQNTEEGYAEHLVQLRIELDLGKDLSEVIKCEQSLKG